MKLQPVRAPWFLLAVVALSAPSVVAATCLPTLGDVAPGTPDTGTSPPTFWVTGDGRVDVGDVVTVLRHSVMLQDVRRTTARPNCGFDAGDVSPGRLDETTTTPTWVPRPDGVRDVGDVIVLLRTAVGLQVFGDPLTYYGDAKAVLDAKCAGCHVAGGVGPFPLTSYAAARDASVAAREAIEHRHMPPWPPSAECQDLLGSRALTDEEMAILLGWIDDGLWEGFPDDGTPPDPPPPPIAYDVELVMPEPYTPDGALTDDYRCFVLDWPTSAADYVTALSVEPDQGPLVHHVIAYSVSAAGAANVRAMDAAEPGPGYTCFGGPGASIGSFRWVGAWAPGASGGAFPDGTGVRVADGSVIVMQVHYNMDSVGPSPDQSRLRMRTEASVQRPAATALLPDPFFFIGAGDPSYEHERGVFGDGLLTAQDRLDIGLAAGSPYVVHGVGLHMHQLGTSTSLEISLAAGPDQCLLDIPEWHFHWQGAYELASPVTLRFDDIVTLRCAWDNSPENQPWIGGVQQQPRDVTWGEGSRDEMCLAMLYVTAP